MIYVLRVMGIIYFAITPICNKIPLFLFCLYTLLFQRFVLSFSPTRNDCHLL